MKMIIKTIGLIILVVIVVMGIISSLNLTNRKYQKLVEDGLGSESKEEIELINSDDLTEVPELVRKYLNYVGVVGTEKVHNFRIVLDGEMKMKRDAKFSSHSAQQTSFIDQGIRLFYMDLYMNGIKISGLHHFDNDDARMKIKVLDIFTVVDEYGENMRRAETVTFFNDMVIFAPQTLISKKISWEDINESSVKATFTHNGITIDAMLFFDEEGKLINFISEDRLALENDGLNSPVPWSTPISEYQHINGLNLPKYGEAVWHYDDGEFTYITLNVRSIKYNIDSHESKN
ncbi:DUF6544 family protein [Gudongella sp. DL1XJH-153]|uniref:DUF6544 family protein n=1 Tax=Gudongella sp. DL1XJH-153 TaxID=3409804 RepID=UPI003BB69960